LSRNWQERLSAYAQRAGGAETRAFLRMVGQPGLISFAGGIPDPALFPAALIADAHRRVLEDPKMAAAGLQYSQSEGYAPLREWIAGHMRGKGVACGIENILITNGSQQGLYLAGRLLLGEGDVVLTERPTYLGLLHALAGNNPKYGLLSVLAGSAHLDAKLAYVMPDFANPTGNSFSLQQRQDILTDAVKHDVVLLEDGAYTDLRYSGAPKPSLQALDCKSGGIERSRVIYCGTFSKTIIPGLRAGWVVAASPVIEKMGLLKQASDFHTAPLTQMVLTDVAQRLPQSHLAGLCETYGARLKAMLEGLAASMPPGISWTKPEGGMFVWASLPHGMDAGELLKEALAAGVAFVPGEAFFPDHQLKNTLRLNFTACAPATISEGLARLGTLIARKLPAQIGG
jgi:DNA-binding transcriptional MocR family regulator